MVQFGLDWVTENGHSKNTRFHNAKVSIPIQSMDRWNANGHRTVLDDADSESYTEHKASGAAFSSIGCLTARREDVDNLHAVARDQGDIRLIVVDAAEAVQRMQAAGGLATAEGGQ